MATFRVKFSKSPDQRTITIRKVGGDSIASATTLVASIYTNDFDTADSTYTLTNTQLTELKTGVTTVATADLLGNEPVDAWYSIILAEGTSFTSVIAGVGITLEATSKVYGKQGYVGVYAPEYRVDEVLHTSHMLLAEMNALENIEVSFQKREDFEQRLSLLKKILHY